MWNRTRSRIRAMKTHLQLKAQRQEHKWRMAGKGPKVVSAAYGSGLETKGVHAGENCRGKEGALFEATGNSEIGLGNEIRNKKLERLPA